jgi:DNA replication protein DnaC
MTPDGLSIPCWRQLSFDEFDTNVDPLRKIATFSKNIVRLKDERIGFLFFGCPGCGKTTAALHVAQSAEAQGLTTLVTSPTRIVNGMLGTSTKGKNEFVDTLCRFDVVVIDDFGTERSTEYSQEQLFCVIDALYRSNALLVITTNLSLAEMRNTKDLMKSRINSRILERCRAVSFPNVDFRINAAKKEYLRAKEIFDEL